MKILMFTNTYLPHVGGVANSVKTFEDEFREMGHEVKVVAPQFRGAEESTEDVLRVPAIQNFNGSDFSVRIVRPGVIEEFVEAFGPDVIHSHHPFLVGDAALRAGYAHGVPVVFTHHTLYENYTHYVPLDSPAIKRLAVQLAVEYSNLCQAVVAPSESVKRLLEERGVTSPVEAIATGIDLERFGSGDGAGFRRRNGIPVEARVIGHVGRLAEEKNLSFLAEAVGECLRSVAGAVVLVVGDGEGREAMRARLVEVAGAGVEGRVIMAGKQTGRELVDAYAAMDLFAFSSQSETQGMVLVEAMAAGKPVVALDGPGVREVVVDGENGRLLDGAVSAGAFAKALEAMLEDGEGYRAAVEGAGRTVGAYSKRACAERVLALYERVIAEAGEVAESEMGPEWDRLQRRVEIEWNLLAEKASAAVATIFSGDGEQRDGGMV